MLSLTAFADELEREKARRRTYHAMYRKAKAGHVTGGRVFGYHNVEVIGTDGRRSHVERPINEGEAAVVRQVFQSEASHRVKTIAQNLNAVYALRPRRSRARNLGVRGATQAASAIRDEWVR